MKNRKPVAAPATLDLDTLDQVIGGCRPMAVQSERAPTTSVADAWSSLTAGFDQDKVANAFMRSHLDRAASSIPEVAAEAAMFLDDVRPQGRPELHCGTMQTTPAESIAPDAPVEVPVEAPIELHCGTMTAPPVDASIDESTEVAEAPCAEQQPCGTTLETPPMHLPPDEPDAPVVQAPMFL